MEIEMRNISAAEVKAIRSALDMALRSGYDVQILSEFRNALSQLLDNKRRAVYDPEKGWEVE